MSGIYVLCTVCRDHLEQVTADEAVEFMRSHEACVPATSEPVRQ